ncbi:MAG: bifunctional N(6)-L-threonylcarbamoyladenine synthase/serine/threonine protein kinase [Methanophagales archaeon]|nr:bifunctional N(6)-L-threonylcarbamoyladenine synthase/serine/threonine protein kinase [Methanophagales archaeon]
MTLILGLEGTAWNLSAALVSEERVIYEAESTYKPLHGGIHPREAAQHHASELKNVVSRALRGAEKEGFSLKDIDAVAFSQGPGMGPCLRTVATAARALSLSLKIPLIGVNHCIAHIEIGRWRCGTKDPVVLYVSGANSQVLAYRSNRYRILGETLDIGIGNALDKFARYLGLSHPGGPKIEELASTGTKYVYMPYIVKGMDLSFSGLTTAAKDALDTGGEKEDICYSFQETAFAMLTEVTERAMAHLCKDEVLLAGGVGANRRLQQMLQTMCSDRGARFYVPENKYLKDNGAMIAYLGLLMLKSGNTTPIEKSVIKPNYRPDEVEVMWRKKRKL